MKKGFTLVELLIVVVVIVTLMAIAFRISGVSADIEERAKTVNRMQRVENCLSGYYAAYGSYPPVAVHGSRDYRYAVNSSGIQRLNEPNAVGDGELAQHWANVEAACRSQPFGFACPYQPSLKNGVRMYAENEGMQFDALVGSGQKFGDDKKNETDWLRIQICKLGVMSYLLPRILVLTGGEEINNGNFFELLDYAQWASNNEKPTDFASGQTCDTWKKAYEGKWFDKDNLWKIALLPSQAMCARWIANLEKIVAGPGMNMGSLYGVDIIEGNGGGVVYNVDRLYSAQGAQGSDASSGDPYVLREYSVNDGWGQELYYYSMPPYQSYTLWSSGPNKKTFPPWITEEELKKMGSDDRATAQGWMADDIVHLKN